VQGELDGLRTQLQREEGARQRLAAEVERLRTDKGQAEQHAAGMAEQASAAKAQAKQVGAPPAAACHGRPPPFPSASTFLFGFY
jgi:hypothetical protein